MPPPGPWPRPSLSEWPNPPEQEGTYAGRPCEWWCPPAQSRGHSTVLLPDLLSRACPGSRYAQWPT
eukprot:10618869-Lingulodinium_polyedra.AAC.1